MQQGRPSTAKDKEIKVFNKTKQSFQSFTEDWSASTALNAWALLVTCIPTFVSLAPSSRSGRSGALYPMGAPSSRKKPCSLTAGKTTRENSSSRGFHLLTFLYTPHFCHHPLKDTLYYCVILFLSLQRLPEAPENPTPAIKFQWGGFTQQLETGKD